MTRDGRLGWSASSSAWMLKNIVDAAMLEGVSLPVPEVSVPLLVLFIIVPIVEIYFLIKVGSIIGVIPTILIVIGTAILGTAMLRQQGLATLQRYQQSVASGRLPAQELIEGLALVFGGALLLTPGFVTDAIGFLCLIPATRQAIIRGLLKRVVVGGFSVMSEGGGDWGRGPEAPRDHDSQSPGGRTIEGEYKVRDRD